MTGIPPSLSCVPPEEFVVCPPEDAGVLNEASATPPVAAFSPLADLMATDFQASAVEVNEGFGGARVDPAGCPPVGLVVPAGADPAGAPFGWL
ncbi:MAG: hypothetical protein KJ000_24195 [Pirellulaceae bacterium]|nr:hypothetical protein [Pirellulaceae bacterium]